MSVHNPRTKAEAHEEALAGDLGEKYTVGDRLDLIIIDSPAENNGREAFARHNDVSVFIYPNGVQLHTNTHVRARVSEIGKNHLKAVALASLG